MTEQKGPSATVEGRTLSRSLRAITVKQPWAWAIIHGDKWVENRGRREPWHTAVGERLAIHAGKSRDDDGCYDTNVRRSYHAAPSEKQSLVEVSGAVLGTAVLADVHHASTCINRQGEFCTVWSQPDQWHLVLAEREAWADPVPARGALGLWRFDV